MRFLIELVFWGVVVCLAVEGVGALWGIPRMFALPVGLVAAAYLNSNGKLL